MTSVDHLLPHVDLTHAVEHRDNQRDAALSGPYVLAEAFDDALLIRAHHAYAGSREYDDDNRHNHQ